MRARFDEYDMALYRVRDTRHKVRLMRRILALGATAVLAYALASVAHAQTPALTTVTGNIYGAPVTVSVTPTWGFVTADGYFLEPNVYVVTASTNSGALSIQLPPNAGSVPSGSSYQVTYSSAQRTWTEQWIVPSGGSATLSQVRVFQPPATTFSFGVNQLIPPLGCANGQALTYNGLQWICSAAGSTYPSAGVANSTGSGWGASFTVGSGANNLPQLNGSGQLVASELPGLTGDATSPAGSAVTTLAATGVTPGSYTTASITVDAKGRVTAASSGPKFIEPGLGDGVNAIPAATYPAVVWKNATGSTITVTGIQCHTDNSGTSTLDVKNGVGTSFLTAAVTCTSGFAAGTQSATTTLANGDTFTFNFTSDGASKTTTWLVTFTY